MAIIYSYPKVTSPLATDVLVLTDTTLTAGKRKNKTKSLAMSDLASYVISSTSAITGSGTTNYIPVWTPDGNTLGDSIMFQTAVGPNATVQVGNWTGGGNQTVLGAGYITTSGLGADQVSATNITSGVTGVMTIRGNAIIGTEEIGFATDELKIISKVFDSTATASTAAGEVLVSTASGQLVWAPAPSGGTVTGTGTTNFVSKWLDSDTIQDSIIFDNGTNVGIGTATPSGLLEIKGARPTLNITNTETLSSEGNLTFQTINSTGTAVRFGQISCGQDPSWSGSGNRMRLGFVGGTARAISIAPSGPNGEPFVGIGTDSPDNNLDVIGGISAQKDGQVFYGKPVTGLATAITEFSNSTGSLEPRIKLVNSTGTTKIVLDGANSPDGGVIFNTTLDVVHDTAIGAAATITNATSSGPTLLLNSSAGGNIIEGGSPANLASFTVNSQGHITSDLTVSGTADFTGLYARFGGQIQDSNNLGGTAGQVLSSTGTGVEWINSTDANTTYDLSGAVSNTNEFAISLSGSDGTLDKVNFIPGTNITLTDNGSNGVTIDADGTSIVPGQAQGYIISVTNKTVGSPDFDSTELCTNVIYNRQVSSSLNWSEYGKQWTPSFDNGYDSSGGFGSKPDAAFSMLEESVKDVLATTGDSARANDKFSIISYDNFMLASHEMPLAVRVDNNGASPGNGTALIKLVENVNPKTGPPNLPSTVCVWFVDTTDTSSNMGGPIPTIVFAGKDTAYAKLVNGGNQYDAGATYTFTGNTGDNTRKYALLIEDEYYSNMRSKYLKVTGGRVVLENLPTSDPSSNGVVWNDSGTLKISAG